MIENIKEETERRVVLMVNDVLTMTRVVLTGIDVLTIRGDWRLTGNNVLMVRGEWV